MVKLLVVLALVLTAGLVAMNYPVPETEATDQLNTDPAYTGKIKDITQHIYQDPDYNTTLQIDTGFIKV